MIGALTTYGALAAKAKALYGKRLRTADYAHMASLKSEAALMDFLRGQPGWQAAAARLGESWNGYIGRVELETALRDQLGRDYLSLQHFAPKADKDLLAFPVRLAEQGEILTALRRLRAGGYYKGPPPVTGIAMPVQVDAKALALCQDYDGIVAAAAGSIYEQTLRHLRPAGGGRPDFTTAEALLRTAYFSHIYRLIHKKYAGETKKILLRGVGEQVDLLNLLHILRLKTYFPGEGNDRYLTVLFPFNYRLRPAFLQQLCAAPDAPAVFELLRSSPYAGCFQEVDVAQVEDYYRRALFQFSRRQLMTGTPSVYTAVSYLHVKEAELQALVNVIESVKYGVPYDAALAELVGA